jgi:hypothetical protein
MSSSSDVAREERRDWWRRHLRQAPPAFGTALSIGSEYECNHFICCEIITNRALHGSALYNNAAALVGLQCFAPFPSEGLPLSGLSNSCASEGEPDSPGPSCIGVREFPKEDDMEAQGTQRRHIKRWSLAFLFGLFSAPLAIWLPSLVL